MTQIGEAVAVIIAGGEEKCAFCGKDHQKEEAAEKTTFKRNMTTLKKEGRAYSIENYSVFYPSEKLPPLVEWDKEPHKSLTKGGYKAAAHHSIALCSLDNHAISGELKEAGYDPNRGSNCAWLPYSDSQFSRARAYDRPLQKHRGKHIAIYFTQVEMHLEKISSIVEKVFCNNNKTPSKEKVLYYMLLQEKAIWSRLKNPRKVEYHLYVESYLEPSLTDAPWGTYEYEKDKNMHDLLGMAESSDDDSAESDNKDDPEK